MRIASPPPGFCSCCFNSPQPDQWFVDFEADYDGAPVLDKDTGGIAIMPWDGQLGGHDNLYLCDRCVARAAELLAFAPEDRARLEAKLRDTEAREDYWKSLASREIRGLGKALEDRPQTVPRTRRRAPATTQ